MYLVTSLSSQYRIFLTFLAINGFFVNRIYLFSLFLFRTFNGRRVEKQVRTDKNNLLFQKKLDSFLKIMLICAFIMNLCFSPLLIWIFVLLVYFKLPRFLKFFNFTPVEFFVQQSLQSITYYGYDRYIETELQVMKFPANSRG